VLDFETGIGEERDVVGPSGSGKEDLLVVGVETVQEVSGNPERTSAREGLNGHNLWCAPPAL